MIHLEQTFIFYVLAVSAVFCVANNNCNSNVNRIQTSQASEQHKFEDLVANTAKMVDQYREWKAEARAAIMKKLDDEQEMDPELKNKLQAMLSQLDCDKSDPHALLNGMLFSIMFLECCMIPFLWKFINY